MRTDPRADAIFKKQYYLNDEQVKVMRDTMNYQATVLRLYLGDLFNLIINLIKRG